MMIHTGEKPHKCNICEKKFAQLNNLKQHIEMHTGEKQHRCEICNAGNAKQKMVTHTGENPHK